MAHSILAYCTIKNNQIRVNGQPVFEAASADVLSFLKAAYQHLNIDYPKFYKMDKLAKLGLVATEFLLKDAVWQYNNDDVALSFVNAHSSADSDWKHQEAINQNKTTSPAVFVYTLPNILLGEIAIKHQWYGENLFTLAAEFSLNKWLEDADALFALQKANFCLGGWVETVENTCEAKLILLAKDEHKNAFPQSVVEHNFTNEWN